MDAHTKAAPSSAPPLSRPVAYYVLCAVAVVAIGAGAACVSIARPDDMAAALGERAPGWNWPLVYLGASSVLSGVLFGAGATALRLLQQVADGVNGR